MLRALAFHPFAAIRSAIQLAGLLLVLTALISAAWAQAREVAALAPERVATAMRLPATYDTRTPHGPVGEAGRSVVLKRGMAHHARGDTERALADYDEAIRLEPDNYLARLNRGILVSTHQAQPARAIANLNRALTLAPGSVDALVFRGDAQMRLGGHLQALADFERAASLAPGNAQVHVLRGVALASLGDIAEALATYIKALSVDRRNVDALVNRAALAAARGDDATALGDLDAAISLAPRHALARYNRGYVRFVRGEYQAAIQDYSAAIDLDPRFGWAYLNRCLVRSVAGRDLGLALADCEQARKMLPGAPQVRALTSFVAGERPVASN